MTIEIGMNEEVKVIAAKGVVVVIDVVVEKIDHQGIQPFHQVKIV